MNASLRQAVFLDRDGVLIADADLLTDPTLIRVLPGVPEALGRLAAAGYKLIVVSNQSVVARGMLTEDSMLALEQEVERSLEQAGAPALDGFYYCPHHPNATLDTYRSACECRKPRPGMLRRAAAEHGIHLEGSFMVGDRLTDIAAGARAGCRTVLVETGKHEAPLIETPDAVRDIHPDFRCADLKSATDWILARK